MIYWPVSRLAYDTAIAERDYLRLQLEKLTDALVRLERKREGLPELAPEKRKPLPELTQPIIDALQAFEGESKARLAAAARHALAGGKSERDILDTLYDAIGEEDG